MPDGSEVSRASAPHPAAGFSTTRSAHQRAGHALQGEWYAKSLRIGGEDRILGITGGASVDALTGWHDPYGVLVLVSESQAEALEESVYEAFDGVTTNANSRIVVVGNPIRPWGPFYNLFQRDTWQHFTTSVYDTPNVKAGRQTHTAFPAPHWPTTAAREHGGPESPRGAERGSTASSPRAAKIVLDPGEVDWVHPSQLAGMYLTPRAADGSGGELVGTPRSFAPPRYVAPIEYWRRERSAEDHPDP